MSLRNKFILLIGSVVMVSFGITFYRTSQFQHELVFSQAVDQARMLSKQVLLTRKWVAEHNGVFVVKHAGVEANPFLEEAEITDSKGRHFVKRNPAMVTREISEYAASQGVARYRVTALKVINPLNEPDAWERKSLLAFSAKAATEQVEVALQGERKVLRYITPLYIEPACLECHVEQGGKVGEIRGGLSLTIPLDRALADIHRNNHMLFWIFVATILVVGCTLYLMVELLVVRRLSRLSMAMEQYPQLSPSQALLPQGDDEVGLLSDKFSGLCARLEASQAELDRARTQVFQSEKLAALGRLAAGVAHEVNNPLGGMLNCLKSMQESPEDGALRQRYLELIEKGLRRIGNTVRQLLNFGRREPLRYSQTAVDDLVRECLVLLEYALKRITLHADLGLGDAKYPIDSGALQQVIVNICLNAVQAMPDGGSLTVTSREEDGWLCLSFTDTGTGIAPADLPRIFDPFFTTKDVGEGTGLGLAVSYALVQRMQGRIAVTSQEGGGSRFVVELPVAPALASETEDTDA
ncbi:MAG: ATP-binding protein [Thermodesulfobacteriota bacterium]